MVQLQILIICIHACIHKCGVFKYVTKYTRFSYAKQFFLIYSSLGGTEAVLDEAEYFTIKCIRHGIGSLQLVGGLLWNVCSSTKLYSKVYGSSKKALHYKHITIKSNNHASKSNTHVTVGSIIIKYVNRLSVHYPLPNFYSPGHQSYINMVMCLSNTR